MLLSVKPGVALAAFLFEETFTTYLSRLCKKRGVTTIRYDETVLSIRADVVNFSVQQEVDINIKFLSRIVNYLSDNCSLLDVGTGNGFVLSQVLKNTDKRIQLIGIDNSHESVLLASENLSNSATIVEADLDDLPFENCIFDVITAKNVTRINLSEIFRVLKEDGAFIFREYGFGKGLIEIAELFDGRIIRQRKPDYYIDELTRIGFQVVDFDQFEVSRKYESAAQLISVVRSFPFIENFSKIDESVILDRFAENAMITSDPFIVVAIKKKGCE